MMLFILLIGFVVNLAASLFWGALCFLFGLDRFGFVFGVGLFVCMVNCLW